MEGSRGEVRRLRVIERCFLKKPVCSSRPSQGRRNLVRRTWVCSIRAARGSWPIVAALHAPLTRLATAIRRHDSHVVSTDEQQVRKRRWPTPGVLRRDGPGRRLSSDKPRCARRSVSQYEWRKMPRGRVEIADLHVRFAALRCNLAKSARVGSFSSAIRTADVTPARPRGRARQDGTIRTCGAACRNRLLSQSPCRWLLSRTCWSTSSSSWSRSAWPACSRMSTEMRLSFTSSQRS